MAGLLLHFECASLGAYRIPAEAGLLTPSRKVLATGRETFFPESGPPWCTVSNPIERRPLSVNWTGADEHYGVRENRFWKPVNFRMRRQPLTIRSGVW
jgi:hypothetical protein